MIARFVYLKDGLTRDDVEEPIRSARSAYNDFVGVSAPKAKNVADLLKLVDLEPSYIFYESMYKQMGDDANQEDDGTQDDWTLD